MVKVKFFGSARVMLKEKEIEGDFASVKDVLEFVADKYGVTVKDMKQHLIYVNEVNITKLKMYKTKLNDGDIIMLLSPASGG